MTNKNQQPTYIVYWNGEMTLWLIPKKPAHTQLSPISPHQLAHWRRSLIQFNLWIKYWNITSCARPRQVEQQKLQSLIQPTKLHTSKWYIYIYICSTKLYIRERVDIGRVVSIVERCPLIVRLSPRAETSIKQAARPSPIYHQRIFILLHTYTSIELYGTNRVRVLLCWIHDPRTTPVILPYICWSGGILVSFTVIIDFQFVYSVKIIKHSLIGGIMNSTSIIVAKLLWFTNYKRSHFS